MSPFEISFPEQADRALDQDEEWCEVRLDGVSRRIRFHDYDEIYEIPGLYERIFYDELDCVSPQTVCSLLAECMEAEGADPGDLRVLDLGAGNGMVGEELDRRGVDTIVGADLIEEAAAAAERDRPGIYDDYVVADFTDLSDEELGDLRRHRFNSLVTVAALGFGDIPQEVFTQAYELIEPGGWLAFNIKEDFLEDGESSYSRLLEEARENDSIEVLAEHRYRHRRSISGEPLYYIAIIARKRDELPVVV